MNNKTESLNFRFIASTMRNIARQDLESQFFDSAAIYMVAWYVAKHKPELWNN
jgi:hypothetical protein